MKLWFNLVAFILTSHSGLALGERQNSFDAAEAVGKADVIVVGHLSPDGNLVQASVLKGEPEPAGMYALDAYFYKSFRKLIEGTEPIKVVAFLSKVEPNRYRVVMDFAGMVAFAADGKVAAWLPSDGFRYNGALGIHPTWNRAAFMKLVDDSLKTDHALELILAKPKSPQRISDALEFLRTNVPWAEADKYSDWDELYPGSYLFSKTTQGLCRPSPEEEEILGRELAAATRTETTAQILAVIAGASFSNKLFEPVRAYVAPTHEGGVRRQAFQALAMINPYQAAGMLAAFLRTDEPEVDCVLLTLGLCADTRLDDPHVLNRAVIEPLRQFATVTLQAARVDPSGAAAQLGYVLLHTLVCYFHPRLLPVMMEWADAQSLPTNAQAASFVRRSLSLKDEKTTFDECKSWWANNRAVIEQCPEPNDSPTFSTWLRVFDKNTDPMFRKLLLRLWVFQPELNERMLLAACTGPSADSAKLLLAELWQKGRLSADTKRQLVHDYLRLRIVVRENPYPATSPKARVKAVVGDRQFPFPEASWVNTQSDFANGREPSLKRKDGDGSSFSLVGAGCRDLLTNVGSVDETAKAVVEISEIHYRVTPSKVLWRLRWELQEGEALKQGE